MLEGEFIWSGGRKLPIILGDKRPRVVVISKNNIGVVLVFKTASRSIVTMGNRLVVGVDNLPDELHIFIRDPINRLKSAYQFFRRRPPIDYKKSTTITWEQFIDYILTGKENPHWRSVSDTIKMVNKEGIITHLFENINEEFPLGKLPHRNKSKGLLDVNILYREDELKKLYIKDYLLREELF